ncbi:Receptor protein kinase-like protein ZAR1 [Linum perenne]
MQYFIFFICSLLHLLPTSHSLTPEGLALLSLKSAVTADPTHSLSSWSDSDPTPCNWHGVSCSSNNQITSISLPNLHLSGYIPYELGLLRSLSLLSLSGNNFSGSIPSPLFNATSLRSLDLSRNFLSGRIPASIGSLQILASLDLSSNRLNGSLPESLVELRSLSGTLNLSWNAFSGEIPESYGRFPVRVSLDLGHNNLTGKVPLVGSLVNQGPTAFSGNPSLCGFPLQTPCPEAVDIPTAVDRSRQDRGGGGDDSRRRREVEKPRSVAVPLISGVTVVIGAITVSAWLVRRRYAAAEKGEMKEDEETKKETNIIVHGGVKEEDDEGRNGKFAVMDEGFCLELEDLLRASAYVAGKGRSGILYKVVVGGIGGAGTVVAVRRLSGDGGAWRLKEFESEVEAIEKVQHPNIVRLRAYYYADDEKLLVSDFIRHGSLYTALHGGPGNLLQPLQWAARLRIAQGAARGIMYIHEYSPRKNVHHGNLKSTKILLDDELQPYVSGFGLTRLVTTASSKIATNSASKKHYLNNTIMSSIPPPSNAYLAPEARALGAKLTQKCDVYAFGIILMELLTGKLPDAGVESVVRTAFREEGPLFEIVDGSLLCEVDAKTQILAVFHIALNCTEVDPELRPRMKLVSESLDRIKMAVK